MSVRRAISLGVIFATAVCGTASAASTELTTANRLKDRREVTAGQRSYAEGFENARWYANGWHITGEMGGVWAPPLKLVDGVWFAVNGHWIGPATRFSSGYGYTRYTLPSTKADPTLGLERIDFAPDANRAVLFGLRMTNPGAARTVVVSVDSHSELLRAYPWGFTTPSASANAPDTGAFDRHSLIFRDGANTDWTALVGSDMTPMKGTLAQNDRGPQSADRICAANNSASPPSMCDDGPYGRGTGGELTYEVALPAHGARTLWIAVAGSDQGLSDARTQLAGALRNPAAELAAKIASRRALAADTVVSLPGDTLLQNAVDWGKQNLADETQTASDLQIRWTNQGHQYPAPLGTVAHARWFAAGYPDYPWIFATDGEYTAFAAVTVGQFTTIEDHLRALRDISTLLNGSSGIVAHETVSDGSVYFGHDSRTTANGTTTNDFNTDETVKFPSAVALVWRWTGDNAFRDEMYDFAVRGMRTIATRYDVDQDGWPEGSGNVERAGMGPEKLDNGVYFMRGLYDLADMARSRHDGATAEWATHLADRLRRQFEATWWDPAAQQYADSLTDPGNVRIFQKYWIGQTPMEAQLTLGTRTIPGVASRDHGTAALAVRENSCYSGERPGNRGLYHNGCGGGADGKGDTEIFSLTTSIQAVGEGNYGRLGPDQQRRYADANAETMFAEPATGGTPDEMPGAMPEIFPSTPPQTVYPTPGIPPNINRCWTCRSSVMQAWGNYGTMWSVVAQQLGVRPFLPYGLLEVVPQVPQGQPSVAGSNIRLGMGGGSLDVFASHSGTRYTTRLSVSGLDLRTLLIGHTLPAGSRPASVTLDGRRAHRVRVTLTNRGVEVTVPVRGGGVHTLEVTAA